MSTAVGGDPLAVIVNAVDALRVASVAQLQAHLVGQLHEVDEAGLRSAIASTEGLQMSGELVFSRASLVAGRTFTARTTTPLLIDDHHDLAPLLGSQRFLDSPSGVHIASSDLTVAVVGAIPAAIDGRAQYAAIGLPSQVVTVDFGSIGPDHFVVESIGSDRMTSGEQEVGALRSAVEQWLPSRRGASTLGLVAMAISLNDGCFRSPTLPLSDLFAAAGLTQRDGEWGRDDEEWSSSAEDMTREVVGQLAAEHHLSADETGDLISAVEQWQQWVGGRSTINAASFVALLTGRVAGAFAEYWQPRSVVSLEEWTDQRRLAETLAVKHGDSPGVNYLRGMIALRLGDADSAFNFFEHAHQEDEDYLPVRKELGLLLLDADRVEEAMDVLPSDLPVFGAVEYLVDRATVDRACADRNDACRCGSDKKYRSCCLKQLRLAQNEQLELIDIRLKVYLAQLPWSIQMERLADIVSTEWGLMSFPEALAEPFVQDILAVESGGAAAYLASRRKLLTESDEQLLVGITPQSRDAYDIETAGPDVWAVIHPDTDVKLRMPALDFEPGNGDAVLVRTIESDGALVPTGPPLFIPAGHVSLLRVTLGSRPSAEQLLGWVCRRSEILRPTPELRGEIDLRDQADDAGGADVAGALGEIDIDDLARRAMEG